MIRRVEPPEPVARSAGTAEEHHEVIQAIGPLHRAGSHVRAVLQSAREMVREDAKLGSFADSADEVSRAAYLLLTDARNAMDYRIAQHASRTV